MNRQSVRRRGKGGSALIEMVLLIPLLGLLLGVTYFFGWSMGNILHVRESSRYATWKHVRTGQGASENELNEKFYERRAVDIGLTRGLGTNETMDDLITVAGSLGGDLAQTFANEVIWNHCQQGRSVQVKARFPSDVGVYNTFEGRINGYHVRDGKQWSRVDGLTPELEVTEVFLSDLDARLRSLEGGGSKMGKVMRVLYRNKWGGWAH